MTRQRGYTFDMRKERTIQRHLESEERLRRTGISSAQIVYGLHKLVDSYFKDVLNLHRENYLDLKESE